MMQTIWKHGVLRSMTVFVTALALMAAQDMAAADGIKEPLKPQAEDHPLKEIWSGYRYMNEELRALQDSEESNPGIERYKAGEALWAQPAGKQKKSCETCHGDAESSMRSAGARFPVYQRLSKKLLTLEGRVNLCREKFMGAKTWAPDSSELLAMTVYVKHQARGAAMSPKIDGPMKEFFDKGQAYFTTRRGQLNLACTHCHGQYAGRKLREATLSQGQSNGFPTYRKSWGKVGSLNRQVNQCLARVRATPVGPNSDVFANLELYLAWRGQGLKVETPAVRP